MSISIFPILRKEHIDKQGKCAIAIRIVRDRKVIVTKPLGYKVDPNGWNDTTRTVRQSVPNHVMLNGLIKQKVQYLEGELMRNQLLGAGISDDHIKRLANGASGEMDYFTFCEEVIAKKYQKPETKRQHTNELTKLRQFRSSVRFADIDYKFLQDYKNWMLTVRGNKENTVWKTLKAMNAMLNEALKVGGLIETNPFTLFDRGHYKQGRRNFLSFEDCVAIEKWLQEGQAEQRLITIGWYYLLMCYAGLRFGDAVNRFDYNVHVVDEERIVMKTEKFDEEIDLLIHEHLRVVLDHVKENKLQISNQDYNRQLKRLGKAAGIDIPLTAHVGRHTFGTMLAEMDVPIEKAQKLLGHRDIESTRIYYHIKNKALDKEMRKFNSLKK